MLLCILFLGQASAQDLDRSVLSEIDSFKVEIRKTNSPEEKAKLYNQVGHIYKNNQAYSQGIESYKNALPLIDSDKFPELYAETNLDLGVIFGNGNAFKPDSSLYYIEQAYALVEKLSLPLQIRCYTELTTTNYALYRFEEAVTHCLSCIELAQKIDDDHSLRNCYNLMATYSAMYLEDRSKVMAYSKLALDMALKIGDLEILARQYESDAWKFCGLGENRAALAYLDSAEKYFSRGASFTDLLLGRGMAYENLKDFTRAKENYKKAWDSAQKLRELTRIMHLPMHLAGIALKEKQYHKAMTYATEALTVAPDKLTLFELEGANKQLYQAYKGLHNHEKALYHFEQWRVYKDSMNSINNLNVIAGLEGKYKNKEHKKQIDFQQIEISRQNAQRSLIIAAMLVFLMLSAGLLFFFLKMRKSREQIKEQHQLISQQSKELRKLDKMKSRFFANVSHELRTPLTLMLGPISSILKKGATDKQDTNRLNKAKRSGKNLLKLIGSILDLSKMESGKMKLIEKVETFYPLVRRIISAFEAHAEREGIYFEFDYQAEENLQLEIDRDKFEIILNNLLSNAVKFTPRDGQLGVKIEDIGNIIQVSVMDTGRGIYPEDLPHIFDRFYQSNHPDATAEGGTGIGLALSYEYVKLMGGEISVKSVVGEGSTFVFSFARKEILRTLPGIEEVVEAKHFESVQYLDGMQDSIWNTEPISATILVVEDNHDLREYLESILDVHYKVIPAENGKIALERLAQNPDCELILSDIMMPVMDGYQLLTTLKSDDLYRHLPVVMLTARVDIKDKLKALRIGVDDYLLKPFEEEELLARIDNLLRHGRLRQAFAQENNTKTEYVPPTKDFVEVDRPRVSIEEQEWLRSVEISILENLSDPGFNTDFLGRKLQLSRRQLQRKLKKVCGLTPVKYINQLRLHEARLRLETGNTTQIKNLALELGFSDEAYFSQQYKKRFGKLPSAY